jgi:hypothetical protein
LHGEAARGRLVARPGEQRPLRGRHLRGRQVKRRVEGNRRVRGEDRRELPVYLMAALNLREQDLDRHGVPMADGDNLRGPELRVARVARKQLGERVDDQLGELEHADEPAERPRGDEARLARATRAGGAGGRGCFPVR